ncbi:MAG: leucine-rich repeat domain-containing protein, partial [Clostridia bacterium]|nr:leucine-rich repeat domain-containing protein [Clostridia bacterium]
MNSTCIKRTLSLFLVLAFFIGTLVFVPVTANAGDNEDWEYYIEDGEVTITGYNGSDTDVTIPSEIDGYPVTEIGDWAFEYCSLTSVTIPDSVMRIGEGAFWGCDSLESVTIPDSVTNIDDEALSFCTALVSINVSDGNPFYKSVDGVLYDKDLTELICCPGGKTNVDIPDSVTSIGDYALKNCYSLTSVTIPDSVTSIGAYAFDGCSVLGSVTIPYSVTSIGEWAFSGCSSLTSVTIPDSVTSLGE